MVNAAGTLYFFETTSTDGKQLYKSDGTPAGIVKVPSSASVYNEVTGTTTLDRSKWLMVLGNYVYFATNTGSQGNEVIYYSPTAAGVSAAKASATDLALGALDFTEWDSQRRTRVSKT